MTFVCSKSGNMERAEELFEMLEAEGLDATLGCYNALMDGYANLGDEEKCLSVFHRLQVPR